ncbi:MAG: protein-L-isoaspartate(D-aspartate) O-methyltransferase [Pirellulales bacterium]
MDARTPELEHQRAHMVRRQLRRRGIRDPRVLTAMAAVPREQFVADADAEQAYADRALAIDCGQTISQPYMVALMTEALELAGDEHVLEIGTGSGYQTAVLAALAASVVSIERHAPLSAQAAERLARFGYTNITLVVADGTLGWPAAAPYDRILVTAAGRAVPPALWEQLAEGGLLVMPVGSASEQMLEVVRKVDGAPVAESLTPCRFVPLVGEQGWSEA